MERNLGPTRAPRGFSLVELLIVVGIISILAAVVAPNIGQYIRNYRIRGAAQAVANVIQEARTRAIMRNVENGISLAIVAPNRYRMVSDDPIPGGTADDQLGPLRELPTGVEFAVNPRGALGVGVRFTRLGALADYTFAAPCKSSEGATCTDSPGRGFGVDTTGAVLRVVETQTGLWRQISIAPGGRVQQEETK